MKNKFIYLGIILVFAWGISMITFFSKEESKRTVNCEIAKKVYKDVTTQGMRDGDADLMLATSCLGYGGGHHSFYNPTTGR